MIDYVLAGRMLFHLGDALDITPSALIKDVEKRLKVIGQGSDPAGD